MPEDLFSRPDHLDVAEFMGFRNKIAGTATSVSGEHATVAIEGAGIVGRARNTVTPGSAAHVAIRPEDLHPVAASSVGLKAQVISTEFRGREFVGFARMGDGTDLSFLATERLAPGAEVTLAAEPDRILVYGAAA